MQKKLNNLILLLLLLVFYGCFIKSAVNRHNLSTSPFLQDTTYVIKGEIPIATEFQKLFISIDIAANESDIDTFRTIRMKIQNRGKQALYFWENINQLREENKMTYHVNPWNYMGYYQQFIELKKDSSLYWNQQINILETDSVAYVMGFVFDFTRFKKSAKVSKETYRKDTKTHSLIFEEEPVEGYGDIRIEYIDVKKANQKVYVSFSH